MDKYGPLHYKKIGYATGSRKMVKDVSVQGIRFLADEFIPILTLLKVEMVLDDKIKQITAIARVRWVRKLAVQDGYEIGAEFEEINKTAVTYLNNYVKEVSSFNSKK